MIGRLEVLRRGMRSRPALLAGAALGACLALAPAELLSHALRACAAACAVGAAAMLVRARLARPLEARRLTVVARQALSRDAGVALVEVDGRAVLIGYGGGPVRLLALGESPLAAEPLRSPEVEP